MFKLTWLHILSGWRLNLLFYGPQKGKNRALAATVGFAILMGFFAVGSYAYGLNAMGAGEQIPLLFLAVCFMMTVAEAMFEADSTLFSYADYDMQASLPLPQWKLVGSRLLVSYLFALLFSLLLLLPSGVVYAVLYPQGWVYWLSLVLLVLVSPLLPTVLGSVIGGAAAVLAARFRRKGAVRTGLLVLVTLALLALAAPAGSASGGIADMISGVAESLLRRLPHLGLCVRALRGSLPALAAFVLGSMAAFLLYALALGRVYGKVRTLATAVRTRSGFTLPELRARSRQSALLWREWKHYLSSPLWVSNTAIGPVIMLGISIALNIAGLEMLTVPGQANAPALIGTTLPMLLGTFAAMSCVTASSVSMEGERLWQLKALPLSVGEIFRAKLGVNLLLTMPVGLVASLLLCLAVKSHGVTAVLTVLLPLADCLMSAVLGLVCNLLLPKLQWQADAEVVKQSAAMAAALFGGMVVCLLPAALLPLLPPAGVLAVGTALSLAISAAGFIWLRGPGRRKFADIN